MSAGKRKKRKPPPGHWVFQCIICGDKVQRDAETRSNADTKICKHYMACHMKRQEDIDFTTWLRAPKKGRVWDNPLYIARLDTRPRPRPRLVATEGREAAEDGEEPSRPMAAPAAPVTVPAPFLEPPPPPPLLVAPLHSSRKQLALLSHRRQDGGDAMISIPHPPTPPPPNTPLPPTTSPVSRGFRDF